MFLYVNGDSYSCTSNGKRYSEFLSEKIGCDYVNTAISGSCNSRIFRTSLRDLMEVKQEHSDIIAVISLSFLLRSEIWQRSKTSENRFTNDGDFVSVHCAKTKTWFDRIFQEYDETFDYEKYSTFRMRWFDTEAETTNLLKDLILFSSWCKLNHVKYLIFSGVLQESVDFKAPFINSFYKEMKSDPCIIDPFETCFTEWCLNRGHKPIDAYTSIIQDKEYNIGHHGQAAHEDFANYLFDTYIKE